MGSETLREAAESYVRKVLELLASNCPQDPDVVPGWREWVGSSEEHFSMRDRKEFLAARLFLGNSAQARSLPEYSNFVSVLRADPSIASQLDAPVGTSVGVVRLSLEEVVNRLVFLMAEKVGNLKFDSGVFGELFSSFESDLRRQNFDYVLVAPLPLFKSTVTPICLEDDLQIDRLTDGEISRCLTLGVPVGIDLGLGMVHLPQRCGIRYRIKEAKRIGLIDPHDVDAAIARWTRRTERILDVLRALRVFKRGQVSSNGFVYFSENWPAERGTSRSGLEPGSGRVNNYELNEKEANAFRDFWARFRRTQETPFLDAAARRFGYAGERHRAEDRLIDLMIAAETLFLSDTTEARERGEMRFRLSLRFAWFIEGDAASQRKRFRQIRDAYDARSALVHGGILGEDLEIPDEGQVKLPRFVDAIEETIRTALQKAINITPFSKTKLVDWDALVFG